MFFSGLIVYMDSQAYGSSAIFGIIEDLKLFTVVSTDPLVTETSRYSWGSSITSFGSISVSSVTSHWRFPPSSKKSRMTNGPTTVMIRKDGSQELGTFRLRERMLTSCF